MANNPKFTSAPFVQITQFTSGTTANLDTDILTVDASNDRRIYGIVATSTDATANNVTIKYNNGTGSFQMFIHQVAANAGNSSGTAQYDFIAGTEGAGWLQRQRDANGSYYFNLPKGHKLVAQYGSALTTTEVINMLVFGETYA